MSKAYIDVVTLIFFYLMTLCFHHTPIPPYYSSHKKQPFGKSRSEWVCEEIKSHQRNSCGDFGTN